MRREHRLVAKVVAGFAGVLLSASPSVAEDGTVRNFDVVVYGATAGGVMAATAASQMGVRVALVDPGRHVGGMVSGGLSHTDVDRQEDVIGGLTLQFFHRLAAHYGQSSGWSFEPHVAEQEFRTLLREAHVQVFAEEQIEGVDRDGVRIKALRTGSHDAFRAEVFIDSSYEGDLMKAAGVSYTVGREGRAKYGESLAGRMDLLPGVHQFSTAVSSDGLAGKDAGPESVTPRITKESDLAATEQGDGRFSLIVTA